MSYTDELISDYKSVVAELKEEGYTGTFTETYQEMHDLAKSKGIKSAESRARDALVAYDARDEGIEIEKQGERYIMVEFKGAKS
jgi:hypothetical protein